MAPKQQPESRCSESSPRHSETADDNNDPNKNNGNEDEDDEIIDMEAENLGSRRDASAQADTQKEEDDPAQPASSAYVAPIPNIGSISPVSPGIQISPADRPDIPPFVGALLVGKPVDEDGDIVDEKTGQVLAHAAGDLPSMVGRRVANAQGDILGDDGKLLGYVADVEWPRARPPPNAAPRSLFDIMGRATGSLMVDHAGNILDASGKVVGRFHDNNNPLHRREKEEKEVRERARTARSKGPRPSGEEEQPVSLSEDQRHWSPPPTPPAPAPPPPLLSPSPHQHQQQHQQQHQCEEAQDEGEERAESQSQTATGDGQPRPRRTEEERRRNAEAWRKENPNESPSDISLDVKSTREGIQLRIRIPTVFNGQQATPHISS
ncbi:hypothetical protein MYCTH_2299606 [Thermothelomyces thermophilus ATCC 42464]|uniref:Uncharacterized protein n=1 Tax=Thermothelomyces thermophilus (strain ATCC 42464 / BCRC 31852 / DSM 1799) TaxID=573729 RepID=G2Q6N2_THET4|nr:uncharacterized protein MYCTH_2299606 [Thermothelomyces thermophilus ATCC 42464]AEO55605.1 hypothetical protein MYCTH_2299606 [Thermothelomyces thermophilus ATCC 42464]